MTKEGDVLLVPLAELRTCVCQVVRVMGSSFLLATFPTYLDSSTVPDLDEIELTNPVFLIETMNESVESERWRVIGNRIPSSNLPIPAFKVQVGLGGDYYIQNFRGEVGRKATSEEAQRLRPHKSFSPGLVEAALRAEQKFDVWLSAYDEMRADKGQVIDNVF